MSSLAAAVSKPTLVTFALSIPVLEKGVERQVLIWYTDRSKTKEGTGYGVTEKLGCSLGWYMLLFRQKCLQL
jgi:hypothetical protein